MSMFWMVLSDKPDRSPPRVRHSSRDAAMAEAKRLASANPGEKFFVLEAIGHAVRVEPTKWEPYYDEIPF